ncbi:MAG: glycoside hydrolase family 97 protein [Calditrichaceae bacterium]
MRSIILNGIVLIALMFVIDAYPDNTPNGGSRLYSPSQKIAVDFQLTAEGAPVYMVSYQSRTIIDTSSLGFTFLNQNALKNGLEIDDILLTKVDDSWEMPWGEQRHVRNNYSQAVVFLKEKQAPGRKLIIYFRAYDDGIAFRYEFPEQSAIKEALITDELTQFRLSGDHTCWWIPGDWDIYEHLYNTTPFTAIDAISKRHHDPNAQSYIPVNAVNTPVTMRTKDGLYLSFHEADLTDYAEMTLKIDKENLSMSSGLVGSDRADYKAKRSVPFRTPWRTIQISETAGGLIESNLIVNLNEPNKMGDVSWFKPTKYLGIWWEMHLGKNTWDMASGRHGATTENAKKLIDFAARNRIGAILVEGWNTGWETWSGYDFVTPYKDYDLAEVVRYGKEKGIELIMHHETAGDVPAYEQQLDTAFTLMSSLGTHAVKTGYVGKIKPKGEYHHGQWMVNHYRKVIQKAAEHQVAVNAHEPIKDTGLRRTYPNIISREGVRGQEYNAWSSDGGNPPEHLSIVAFTRMLAGPIDFTPGVFNLKLTPYKENNQVNTTLAHQLALYVVIYSPIQMVCDLIENYENQPAFQFIRDVGVNWERTKVLNGEVGDFVTIARQERGTGRWFVGSITDEHQRSVTIDFSFLDDGVEYQAVIYKDGPDAHWNDNPESIKIVDEELDRRSKMSFTLAPGGGLAISLQPVVGKEKSGM